MKKKHITFMLLVIIILLPLFNGCSAQDSPVKLLLPIPADGQQAQPTANSNRFQNNEQTNSNAIKSAIEVSEKYALLASEAAELKQQNKILKKENDRLNNDLKQTKGELNKTQKELSEANDMIMETTIELNNWKNSVLGFREEMRQANIAQIQSLQEILVILGGEEQSIAMDADTSDSETNTETQ